MLHIWAPGGRTDSLDEVLRPAVAGTGIQVRVHTDLSNLGILADGSTGVVMGGSGLKALQSMGVVRKNSTINSMREVAHKLGDGRVFVTFSTGIMELDPAERHTLIWDFRLAVRWIQTKSLDADLSQCKYEYVQDFGRILAWVKRQSEPVYVGLDTETIGLDEYAQGSRIVTIQVSPKLGVTHVYYCDGPKPPEQVLEQVQWLCSSDRVRIVGANLKFDARWLLRHWGIRISNHWYDTYLGGSLLNENISNSLNRQAKMYTSIGGYDDPLNNKHDKSRMDRVPKDELLPYAAGDPDACLRVFFAHREEMKSNKHLLRFYRKVVHPAAEVFTTLESRGVIVDRSQYDQVRAQVQQGLEDAEQRALSFIPRKLKLKYADNLSLTRAVLLRDLMFTGHGFGFEPQMWTAKSMEAHESSGGRSERLPSTAEEHLSMFRGGKADEFLDALADYNSAKKTLSTFVDGFLKHLRSDGRFHPTYYLGHGGEYGNEGGTVSGRSACKDPAYQTMPKHTKWAPLLRTVFVPPPGYVILKDDYDQGELRVCADITGDSAMIRAYHDGVDLHLKTGAALNHISLDEALRLWAYPDGSPEKTRVKSMRQGGKVGNFGLIYRISPAGLVAYAWAVYGVKLTEREAAEFQKAFFALYPGIKNYHDSIVRTAQRDGMVRSPMGRIRHLPLINSRNSKVRGESERQAINSPVQGTLTDMKVLGMVELARRYPDLWMFGFTHDETQYYVPEDDWELWARRIREVNENLPLREYFNWTPKVPFPVEVQMSAKNLATCVKVSV